MRSSYSRCGPSLFFFSFSFAFFFSLLAEGQTCQLVKYFGRENKGKRTDVAGEGKRKKERKKGGPQLGDVTPIYSPHLLDAVPRKGVRI